MLLAVSSNKLFFTVLKQRQKLLSRHLLVALHIYNYSYNSHLVYANIQDKKRGLTKWTASKAKSVNIYNNSMTKTGHKSRLEVVKNAPKAKTMSQDQQSSTLVDTQASGQCCPLITVSHLSESKMRYQAEEFKHVQTPLRSPVPGRKHFTEVYFRFKFFLLLQRHDNDTAGEVFVHTDVVAAMSAHVGRGAEKSLA